LIPFDHGYLFYFGRERESLYLPLTGFVTLITALHVFL
jgi:hypothetical protein